MRRLTFALGILMVLPVAIAGMDNDFEADPYVILCGEADAAIDRGDYAEAAARINDAIRVKPYSASNVLLLANLGMVYLMMDSDSLALATLDRAIADYPDMKVAHLNRAKVLLKNHLDNDAFMEFEEVLALDSMDAEARYYRGLMSLYGGKRDVAEVDFEVLRSLEPGTSRTARALSALYSLTGRPREALPYYRALIVDEPAPEYYSALAGCLLDMKDLSEAAAVLADGLKLYPEDPELYYYRARLNRDRYRLDDAKKDGKKAKSLGANPRKVDALFKKTEVPLQ